MYCYQALHPYNPSALLQIWSAVTVSVAMDTGFPPSVELVLLENGTLPSPLGPHGSALILSPFHESCVEVRAIGPTSSSNPDTYSLMVRHKTKLRYLALMAIGLILFFGAPSASRFVRHHPLFNWLLVSQITFTHPSPLPPPPSPLPLPPPPSPSPLPPPPLFFPGTLLSTTHPVLFSE